MNTTRKSLILKVLSVVFVLAISFSALLYAGVGKTSTVQAQNYAGHTTDNVFMLDGASVRVENGTGIRFTAYYDKSYIDGLDNPTIGMFIAKASNVDGELTAATAKKQDCVMLQWSNETPYHYIYSCVLRSIPVANYDTDLVARAYVLVDEDYTYNSVQVQRSVSYVAGKALLSGDFDDNASAITVLNNYVSNNTFTIAKSSASVAIGYSVDLANTDLAAKWVSDDTSVATVDENGTVTAVAAGSATITATYGATSRTCAITVLDKTVNSGLQMKITATTPPKWVGCNYTDLFTPNDGVSLTTIGTVLHNGVETAFSFKACNPNSGWSGDLGIVYPTGFSGFNHDDELIFKKGFGIVYGNTVYVLDNDYTLRYMNNGSGSYYWIGMDYTLSLTTADVSRTDGDAKFFVSGSTILQTALGGTALAKIPVSGGGIYKNGVAINYNQVLYHPSYAFILQTNAYSTASNGDVLTFKKGTTFSSSNGRIHYVLDKDYEFVYNSTFRPQWVCKTLSTTLTFNTSVYGNGGYGNGAKYIGCNLHTLTSNDEWKSAKVIAGNIKLNGTSINSWACQVASWDEIYYADLSPSVGDKITIDKGTVMSANVNSGYYVTDKDYTLIWNGATWVCGYTTDFKTISIPSLGTANASIMYLNISGATITGYKDWNKMFVYCADGGILKNGVEISYLDVGAIEAGTTFYIDNLSATSGCVLTIKKGTAFAGKKDGSLYVVDQNYYLIYDGSSWTKLSEADIPETTQAIAIAGYYSGFNQACRFAINRSVGDNSFLTAIGDAFFYDASAGTTTRVGLEFSSNTAPTIMFKGFGTADTGDIITLKQGFKFIANSTTYYLNTDYTFTWTGSAWTIAGSAVNKNMSFSAPVTSITSRSAIYLREDVNVYGTTSAANWSSLSVSGDSPKLNGETFTPTVQVCEWANDLYLTGFGTAKDGDELFIPAGFTVSKTIGLSTYNFTLTEDASFTYYGSVGWKLTGAIDIPATKQAIYFGGYSSGFNQACRFVISRDIGDNSTLTAIGDAQFYDASAGTTTYKILDFSSNTVPTIMFKGFGTADTNDVVILKKGFKFIANSTTYYLDTEWQFTYNGSGWSCATAYEQTALTDVFKLGNFGVPSTSLYEKYAEANYNYVLYDQNSLSFTTTNASQASVEAFKAQERYLYDTYGIYTVPMVFAGVEAFSKYDNDLATEGYAGKFFKDEPSENDFATLAGYITAFEAQNPYATFYNNLYPIYNSDFGNNYNTYKAYIEAYCETVLNNLSGSGQKVIMVDIYPLVSAGNGKGVSTTDADSDGIVDRYLANLEILAQAAKKYGARVEVFYQLGSLYDVDKNSKIHDDVDTLAKLRFQFNAALAYGVKGLWSYSYINSENNGVIRNSVVDGSSATTISNDTLQGYITTANADVKAFADVYMQYTYRGTGVCGSSNGCWSHLQNTLGWTKITSSSGTKSTLCGEFCNTDTGKYAYMVSNFDYSNSNTVSLTFNTGVAGYYMNGEYYDCEGATTINIALTAGAGAFVVLN
ncbi:MAG: Ig-like domain-containing protein [Clostridia bacterium]|nr:Ig-like domain-containing protein [Clostridia bacterium]